MDVLLDIVRVDVGAEYALHLEFENGERRIFDMRPYMDRKPFTRIREAHLFVQASVDYGTVVWPGNIDISPETLYDRSVPISRTAPMADKAPYVQMKE